MKKWRNEILDHFLCCFQMGNVISMRIIRMKEYIKKLMKFDLNEPNDPKCVKMTLNVSNL